MISFNLIYEQTYVEDILNKMTYNELKTKGH